MKATLYSEKGEKKSQIELPKLFSTKIREDLVNKYLNFEKKISAQPYSPDKLAGKKYSASGTISHKRHDWKGHYGKGISRIPRKTMWRRGDHFFWVGATISSTRGGRRAHPPKLMPKKAKINKKEILQAFNSALASTASQEYIIKRYATLDKITQIPIAIESLPKKTKDLMKILKTIFPENFSLIVKKKTQRAGIGKMRGRKYKSNAGLLIITAPEENARYSTLDLKTTDDITMSDLYPLGRLTIYTKKALESLAKPKTEDKKETKEKEK